MDEQRILDELERRLADDDPRLASRLASFGHPRLATAMRSRRARLAATVLTLLLIAVVAVMVYSMLPFRAGIDRQLRPQHSSTAPGVTQTRAATAAATARPAQPAAPGARRP
jgi:hypothetical protein